MNEYLSLHYLFLAWLELLIGLYEINRARRKSEQVLRYNQRLSTCQEYLVSSTVTLTDDPIRVALSVFVTESKMHCRTSFGIT